MLGAPRAAVLGNQLAAKDRSALRVDVARISGNESTTATRNGFAAHRFLSLSDMSTKRGCSKWRLDIARGRAGSKIRLRQAAYRQLLDSFKERRAIPRLCC